MKLRDWTLIGVGRNRAVYRRGNYVVKVPLNEDGVSDNYHERQCWLRDGKLGYIPFARCRLSGDLLVMQYARFPGPLSDETGYIPLSRCPEWAYAVDCSQVGYNRFREIVAYDFGIN